ncbi:MAG: ABC transporter substrate-binding protein [Thermodesulfobacteriota bacterium]
MKSRASSVVFLSAVLAFVLTIGSSGDCRAEVVLRVAVSYADAGQLDPHLTSKTQDVALLQWMFNALVRFKPGAMDPAAIEPDLAEKWTVSPDGKTWTFHLRQGIKFHGDYGELTSEDVVYSLNRAKDPKTSAFSSDFAEVKAIEAVNPYTVKISLQEKVPFFLGIVCNYHGGLIVSKKAAEKMGDKFMTNPIGTGPFMFEELKAKQYVSLAAHKQYFRGTPKIARIIYRYIPSASSLELAYRNGEIDLFYGERDQAWVERMRGYKDTVVDVFRPGEHRSLHLNTTMKPFDDIRVRRAVAQAINRDEIVQFLGKDVSEAAWSIVPNGYLGHATDGIPRYEYNPDQAKALLKEAGFANGFSTKVLITNVDALLKPMQIVQEQLRRVGLQVNLEVLEHATWHEKIRKNLSSMVLYGAARFPIADTYLTQFYHSRSIIGGPKAVTNFSHTKLADQEIDAARTETNAEKQLELWKAAQKKIMTECNAIPVFELKQVWCRRANLDYGNKLTGCLNVGPVLDEKSILK